MSLKAEYLRTNNGTKLGVAILPHNYKDSINFEDVPVSINHNIFFDKESSVEIGLNDEVLKFGAEDQVALIQILKLVNSYSVHGIEWKIRARNAEAFKELSILITAFLSS